MRRFYLLRKEDPNGMSNVGRVADGIEFENGQVALTWKKEFPSVTVFPSVSVVERLHSHNGKDPTKIVWVDDLSEDVVKIAEALRLKKKEEEEKEEKEEAEAAALERQMSEDQADVPEESE